MVTFRSNSFPRNSQRTENTPLGCITSMNVSNQPYMVSAFELSRSQQQHMRTTHGPFLVLFQDLRFSRRLTCMSFCFCFCYLVPHRLAMYLAY